MAKWVKDTDLGLNKFIKELAEADRVFVTVGVHQGERDAEGADIAEYATANEYGTDNIPSRPFMRTTFDENIAKIQSRMDSGYRRVQDGFGTTLDVMKRIGEWYASTIQNTIQSRDFLPKLKDATIKAKKGSAKTLIDTGAMVGSIRYVVHK